MEENFGPILKQFLNQAEKGDFKTSIYPKTWVDFRVKVSFGIGMAAHVPWIAFTAPEMEVSKGFYPVYLYYKAKRILILAYGVSETEDYEESWPIEVQNDSDSVQAFLGDDVPRYGTSFVFKAYSIKSSSKGEAILEYNKDIVTTDAELDSDLNTLLSYYSKIALKKSHDENSVVNQGRFFIEKQLEDFLVHNWDHTELGKRYELLSEDGEQISQQYKTEIGPIDLLVKDKKTKDYVVIELKKGQTSDDTVGQAARYMGWVQTKFKTKKVKGIIIAGTYDRRLEFALKAVPDIDVYLYDVSFRLKDFGREE